MTTALVTGASAGIGLAFAQRLAREGNDLVLVARDRARLERLARELRAAHGVEVEVLVADLSDRSATWQVCDRLAEGDRPIDLLVNNAGFGVAPAAAEESSLDQARAIFDTNFFGIIRMTRAVVPHMRRQGSGRIINIGSVLGFLPMPYMALYSATKHAVAGYSEALDHELRTLGIRVSLVEPAYINTPFEANLLAADAPLDVYRNICVGVEKRVKEVLVGADGPEVVAEMVLTAAQAGRPKLHYTPGLAKRMQLLRRFAPASVLDAGVRKDLRLQA